MPVLYPHYAERSAEICLAVSGSDTGSAGAFLIASGLAEDEPRLEHIDSLTSHGLCVDDTFVRLIVSTTDSDAVSEMLVYDERGVALYRRIDDLADPHGLAWDGTNLVVPNTSRNQIVWLQRDGTISRIWQATALARDTWHINGVDAHGGRLFASAFGRYASEAEFHSAKTTANGLVFDVETREVIVRDLNCPHDPRFFDSDLLICDSSRHRLSRIDIATGTCLATANLGRWTRGLALTSDRIYVGLSAHRYEDPTAVGALAILNRADLRILRIVPLPCREVNSVVVMPKRFLGSLRRGFRTNSYRVLVQDREDMFRLVGNIHPDGAMTRMRLLEADECRARLSAVAPEHVPAGETFNVTVTIVNDGPHTLLSAPPYPVNLGFDFQAVSGGNETGRLDERRYALPEPIAPTQSVSVTFTVRSPEHAGAYLLAFSLVQETVRWFKDVDSRAEAVHAVVVGTPTESLCSRHIREETATP